MGHGLWRSASDARARAELAARTEARSMAQALRALLHSRAVLALIPPQLQLRVRAGALVVDPEVGWLEAAPESTPDPLVVGALRTAAIAEFERADAAAAVAALAAVPNAATNLTARAAAAWQAQRAGAAEPANEHREALLAELVTMTAAAMADADIANATAATALLLAAQRRPRPAELDDLLAALPPAMAMPMFARLQERGAPADALLARHAGVDRRRQLLRHSHPLLRALPNQPAVRSDGERFVLWFPDDGDGGGGVRTGDGVAACLDREFVAGLPARAQAVAAANLPPVQGRGSLRFTAEPDAEPVLPEGPWVAPLAAPPLPWSARPLPILSAGGLLATLCCASAWLVLRTARAEARALRLRSEFLTGVTHELKTPLAAIRLITDVLRDDDVPAARQRDYLALMAAETARLSTLIDNVLDLGRVERGERIYDRRPGDLAAVVRECAATFAPLAQRARLELVVREQVAAAAAVFDAGAIHQVLLNLLDNARKYGAAGGRIELVTRATATEFVAAVRDFGPGVAAAEHEAIFERFQRGAAHRHGAVPGTGLGLFLARAIATDHGGSLTCSAPADGPGACFTLSLPMTNEAP